jgi:hypothetical protein
MNKNIYRSTFVDTEFYKNPGKRRDYISRKLDDALIRETIKEKIPMKIQEFADRTEYSKEMVIITVEEYNKLLEK